MLYDVNWVGGADIIFYGSSGGDGSDDEMILIMWILTVLCYSLNDVVSAVLER